MKTSEAEYILYPANKTGSKKQGYPELDTKMSISKTNFRRFYLQEFSKTVSIMSTEYNLELKYGIEKKPENSPSNCCLLMKLFTI